MSEPISKIDASELALNDKLIYVNRVSKVVKGGKRLSFSALVVTGDGSGHVGIGVGKANEVPEAIRKAMGKARRDMIEVPIVNTTIPHAISARFSAAKVFLWPACKGTGVTAGGPMRAVLEAAGVHNILTKSLGSRNAVNVVKATMQALGELETGAMVARRRDVKLEQIFGSSGKEETTAS